MQIDFWAETDVGKQRDHNEDNYLVDKPLKLFVVADGMGGHAAGEVASSVCVRRVREVVAENRDVIERAGADGHAVDRGEVLRMLESAVQQACTAIYERSQENPDQRGMGTTCSLLLLLGTRGFIAHVGDSRIYLMRNEQVHQLSEDHSLVNELVRRGKLKLGDIDNSPYKDYKNAVTRAVGVYESVEVDTLDFDVLPGDQFLLCSDGLHHYLVDDEKIADLLTPEDIKTAASGFTQFANDGGGHDNITTILVRIGSADEEDAVRSREVSLRTRVLKEMPLFRYLSYKELVHVMNITQVRTYQDDQLIIGEGDPAHEMFIILDGKVRLHKDDAFITFLKPGDHFGEMALVDKGARSASASAEGTARVLIIHRDAFFSILRDQTKASVKILWSLTQVLTARLRKTTADLSSSRMESTLPDLTEEIQIDELSLNEIL